MKALIQGCLQSDSDTLPTVKGRSGLWGSGVSGWLGGVEVLLFGVCCMLFVVRGLGFVDWG